MNSRTVCAAHTELYRGLTDLANECMTLQDHSACEAADNQSPFRIYWQRPGSDGQPVACFWQPDAYADLQRRFVVECCR